MKLKVCGMKYPQNIADVAALKPDFMGFIFYAKSPRFVEVEEVKESIEKLDKSIAKVGVFVNHPVAEVIETCKELGLNLPNYMGTNPWLMFRKLNPPVLACLKYLE